MHRGIPERDLIAETQGSDTAQSAMRVAVIMRANGLHSCVAVSDAYHVFRIKKLLEHEGIAPVYVAPRPDSRPHGALQRALCSDAGSLQLPGVEVGDDVGQDTAFSQPHAILEAPGRFFSPAVSLSQAGDMGDVMASVPGVESEIFLQWYRTQLGMAKFALPLFGSKRPQKMNPARVQ